MVTAQFGTKKFEVKKDKIYTPKGTSISESIELEEEEVSKKKPTTKVKGIKLQTLSFEIQVDSRFVDVDNELRWWKNKLLAKSSEFFYLGKFKVGKFYLTQYDIKDFELNKNGDYRKATISLSFTEDGTYANKTKINFETTNKKATSVKKSTSSSKSKNIKVGTYVKPKKNTRWYYTAEGAIKKTGRSGKAQNKKLKVSYIYKNGKAINPQGLGWMLPSDVDVV